MRQNTFASPRNVSPGVYYVMARVQVNSVENHDSPIVMVSVHGDGNNGSPGCGGKPVPGGGPPPPARGVGEPVNVTDGNMYLDQADFVLPGPGVPIDLTAVTTAGIMLPGYSEWAGQRSMTKT